jgi:L-fuconolactonase
MSISRLLSAMRAAGVDRVVIVPPNWEGMRNDYATEAYDSHPDRFRFMGRLNLDRPDAPAQLASWMQLRGNLGMRQSFLSKRERGQLVSGTYDWLWQGAERYGIPLMVHASGLGPGIERIARRHPSLKLILDHMGLSSGIVREGRLREAATATIALAQFPNVFVKLSSAPLRSRENYPFRDMHDYIHRIIDAFGPKRSFWGTDLSHMLHVCGYREGVTLFTEELGLSASDLDWIMGRALCECLNWPVAT